MAKLGDNIMGAGKGKVGDVVLYNMHGKSFMRAKPSKYTDRKSEAQLAQRAKMQAVSGFMAPLKELIRKTWATEAVGRAPYHAAKSQIMRNAVQGSYPDFGINKEAAMLSKGPLPVPKNVTVALQDGALMVQWTNTAEDERLHGKDTLLVVALNTKTGDCEYLFTPARRRDKSFRWDISMPVSENDMPDIWVAFRSNNETEMSDSVYVK